MVRAYIINTTNGTVQIGDTLYQPVTGASFKTNMKGLRGKPYINVSGKSMANALKALKQHYLNNGRGI